MARTTPETDSTCVPFRLGESVAHPAEANRPAFRFETFVREG